MTYLLESDNRLYPQLPMVGVGAVVIKGGQILLVKRSKDPGKGKWSIPGGRLELGETIYEAARREVFEECSIEIEIERLLDVADSIVRDEDNRVRYHYILIDLLARYRSGEIRAQSDADECRWITTEDLTVLDIIPKLRDILIRAMST